MTTTVELSKAISSREAGDIVEKCQQGAMKAHMEILQM